MPVILQSCVVNCTSRKDFNVVLFSCKIDLTGSASRRRSNTPSFSTFDAPFQKREQDASLRNAAGNGPGVRRVGAVRFVRPVVASFQRKEGPRQERKKEGRREGRRLTGIGMAGFEDRASWQRHKHFPGLRLHHLWRQSLTTG